MRTTLLLSTFILIAGHLAAQDSPITIADSGPPIDNMFKKKPKKDKAAATAKATPPGGTWVIHDKQFKEDTSGSRPLFRFAETDASGKYQAVCLDIKDTNRDRVFFGSGLASWSITLDNGVKITSGGITAPSEVDLDANGITHTAPAQYNKHWLLSLQSSMFSTVTVATTPVSGPAPAPTTYTAQAIVLHYCVGNDCGISLPCN